MIWGLRPRICVFGGREPGIFEVFAFDGETPHVAVDGVYALVVTDFAEFEPGAGGELFLFVAGHAPLASWRDDTEGFAVCGEGFDAGVEADLVVSFAGTSVCDGDGSDLPCGFNEFLGHQGAAKCGGECVNGFVHGAGFEAGDDEVAGELVFDIPDQRFDGSSRGGAFSDAFEFGSGTDVDAECYDVEVVVFTDPDDGDGGVHSAAVGEYALVSGHLVFGSLVGLLKIGWFNLQS